MERKVCTSCACVYVRIFENDTFSLARHTYTHTHTHTGTRVVLQYKLSGYVESHDIMMCRVLEGFQVKTLSTAADLNHRNNIKGFVPPEEGSKCHLVSQCKLEYPWQPDVRIQYTFCIWWIVRRAQQKRVRVITVQISATVRTCFFHFVFKYKRPYITHTHTHRHQ